MPHRLMRAAQCVDVFVFSPLFFFSFLGSFSRETVRELVLFGEETSGITGREGKKRKGMGREGIEVEPDRPEKRKIRR